jgi:hypothetical protein
VRGCTAPRRSGLRRVGTRVRRPASRTPVLDAVQMSRARGWAGSRGQGDAGAAPPHLVLGQGGRIGRRHGVYIYIYSIYTCIQLLYYILPPHLVLGQGGRIGRRHGVYIYIFSIYTCILLLYYILPPHLVLGQGGRIGRRHGGHEVVPARQAAEPAQRHMQGTRPGEGEAEARVRGRSPAWRQRSERPPVPQAQARSGCKVEAHAGSAALVGGKAAEAVEGLAHPESLVAGRLFTRVSGRGKRGGGRERVRAWTGAGCIARGPLAASCIDAGSTTSGPAHLEPKRQVVSV